MSESAELSASPSDPLTVGAIVGGRYELRRVLGRGAAAVVFAAEHVLVRRQVAIKLPLNAPELRELLCARLRREIDALARIRHPVIVDVIDAGDSDDLPFLAMELLEGRTLAGLIAARGKLSPEEVQKVGIDLADGLTAVHEAGFIHRDVKPANVLVTRTPANQIHLFDFGIVKLCGAAEGLDRRLTQNGSILGTPEYMALETWLDSGDIDHRVDVYSLGVTLFESLTGVVPVEGALSEILGRLSNGELPKVTDLRPDVPAPLAEIVGRCLATDPAKRYASTAEVSAALRACAERPLDTLDLLRTTTAVLVPTDNAGSFAATAPLPLPEARRVHMRAPYVTPATLQRDGGAATAARIEDISEGGVLLITEAPYAQQEVVRLRFSLPISGRVVAARATVRWSRKARGSPATGLEFDDLTEPARNEISKYVELMNKRRG